MSQPEKVTRARLEEAVVELKRDQLHPDNTCVARPDFTLRVIRTNETQFGLQSRLVTSPWEGAARDEDPPGGSRISRYSGILRNYVICPLDANMITSAPYGRRYYMRWAPTGRKLPDDNEEAFDLVGRDIRPS